ncbi:hypothetical protein TNCV_2536251 [Trichonephila clavipes]|nr:hypothetical protein TNCV_2536251 [Trichonephila clavipes]
MKTSKFSHRVLFYHVNRFGSGSQYGSFSHENKKKSPYAISNELDECLLMALLKQQALDDGPLNFNPRSGICWRMRANVIPTNVNVLPCRAAPAENFLWNEIDEKTSL